MAITALPMKTRILAPGLHPGPGDISACTIDSTTALELKTMFAEQSMSTARALRNMMPEAGDAWLYGPEDWSQRGHAVVSFAVLMASAVKRLSTISGAAGFSYPEEIENLWPDFLPVTHRLALGLPAGTSVEAMSSLVKMLEVPHVRVSLSSLDDSGVLIPDGRSQILLSEAGIIRGAAASSGYSWRLAQKPIDVRALKSISAWLKEAVDVAASCLIPVVEGTRQMDAGRRGAALIIAAGQAAAHIPLSDQGRARGSGLAALLGKMLGGSGARIRGLSIWGDPWGVFSECLEMARVE